MDTRIHVAIAVRDVERALPFYRALFGAEPAKVRPGYAKFDVANPSVNFSLNASEQPTAPALPYHYGIQVQSTEAVRTAQHRLEAAGLETETEDNIDCCYSTQDKIWATDPDGHRWEVFVVTKEDAETYAPKNTPCCDPTCCT